MKVYQVWLKTERLFKIFEKQKPYLLGQDAAAQVTYSFAYDQQYFHEALSNISHTRALPLAMWVLKLRAVSSYMPCLGSGALGGSSSLSGSWRMYKNP